MNTQKDNQRCRHTEQRPREHTGGRRPSARQERGLRENQTRQHRDAGLPASRTARNKCLLYKLPVLWFAPWLCELTKAGAMGAQPGWCSFDSVAGHHWEAVTLQQLTVRSALLVRHWAQGPSLQSQNFWMSLFFKEMLTWFWKSKWGFYGNNLLRYFKHRVTAIILIWQNQ